MAGSARVGKCSCVIVVRSRLESATLGTILGDAASHDEPQEYYNIARGGHCVPGD